MVWKVKGLAQGKTKRTTKSRPRKASGKGVRRTTKKKNTEPSLLKYEIFGIVLLCCGIFTTVGIIGIDTGSAGHSIDGILSYIFGMGRIVFTLSMVVLGLKYIILRKAWPLTKNWLAGGVLFVLFLGLIHLLFIPQGAEFMPAMLRVGGGAAGAVVASLLRSFLGEFGAVLVVVALGIVTLLVWKKWSISRPVALVSDKASEEVSRVSDKAVEGLQEASRSMQQWHEHHHIFDLEKEEQEEKTESAEASETVAADREGAAETEPLRAEDPRDGDSLPHGQRVDFTPEERATLTEEEEFIPGLPQELNISPVSAAPAVLPTEGTPADDSDAEPEDTSVQQDERQKVCQPVRDVLQEELADLKPVEIDAQSTAVDVAPRGHSAVPAAKGENTYRLPSISLLRPGKPLAEGLSEEARQNAVILQETLKSFNIEAKVTNASQGPSVTRYELEPAAGVRVSRIVGLADDIALNLAATQVFIEAPIPGKAAVGIEVPNKTRTGVNLRDVLDTNEFKNAASGVPVSLGKDIAGNPVIADLTKMPHLLVAGTTGSGKSVCINTFIASILFKQRPEDVKLVLIDPKVVELSVYNGIPHLMTPVVTDPKKAANALRWAVREMDDRYKRFSQGFARDIKSFNEKYPDEAMPYVVIIIDEMADLMMAASSDVEDSICRLAQKARACGMHLVLATQRPSVDVITGLIKANIPSRIAFRVSSQTDSRTILDMGGAEKLIGNGDMFYFPTGAPKPIRVQGAFISDAEIEQLVTFIKNQNTAEPKYDESIQQSSGESSGDTAGFFEDELMPQAIDMVLETGQASSSMLQRRFRVGFTRAARMIDTMEAMGIVGPNEGNKKPREIIMSPAEVQEKFFHKDT